MTKYQYYSISDRYVGLEEYIDVIKGCGQWKPLITLANITPLQVVFSQISRHQCSLEQAIFKNIEINRDFELQILPFACGEQLNRQMKRGELDICILDSEEGTIIIEGQSPHACFHE